MIIGNPSVFAIESETIKAYERLSFRALGFFVIHVGNRCFGVHRHDATMLACSFDEVERRISCRGGQIAPFSNESAGSIADAILDALYVDKPRAVSFEFASSDFLDAIYSKHIIWAPDGDEAFDDGSYVLQFDVQDRVRLIAFKSSSHGCHHDPSTLRDVWLLADDFYCVLQKWRDNFETEWIAMPKES